ncbi:MAG: glutamate synthase large chain, partial [Micromonosporaceae bacterium]|nr:glutamate synthase large chain [Micromonosporaceae bacterium]
RVNPEMVDLQPVAPQSDEEDALFGLVRRHAEETGSRVAASLLARWDAALTEFTAVVPRDYRRVMEAIRAAEAAGHDVDEAVMSVVTGAPAPAPAVSTKATEAARA